MKIIFLDMDGVLNSAYLKSNKYIEKDKFELLQIIVRETGAKVVLSTSWREFPDWRAFLTDFFGAVGIEVVGSTPVDPEGIRPNEIMSWLEACPDVESYVVLDDNDMTESFNDNMVCTCGPGRIGLDADAADRAIMILNGRALEEEVERP